LCAFPEHFHFQPALGPEKTATIDRPNAQMYEVELVDRRRTDRYINAKTAIEKGVLLPRAAKHHAGYLI
jgi:hypothetical protein